MRFKSTDSSDTRVVSVMDSIIHPLPDPSNLWIPATELPVIFGEKSLAYDQSLYKVATVFLDDLNIDVEQLCRRTIRSSTPSILRDSDKVFVDLCGGPCGTSADLSSRFLVSLCSELLNKFNYRFLTSTTGDNGCAIANACTELQGSLPATIMYSGSRIPVERYDQLHGFEDNEHRVVAIAQDGDYNACYSIVAKMLSQPNSGYIAANSLNYMYLIPMIAYYAWIATECPEQDVFVPAGVCSEPLAALTAKAMGAPLGHIHCTDGANDFIGRFLRGENNDMRSSNTIASIAPYLDVQSSPNVLRILAMYQQGSCARMNLAKHLTCHSVSDDENVKRVIEQLDLDTMSAMSCISSIFSTKVTKPVIPVLSKQRVSVAPTKVFCQATKNFDPISAKKSIILVGMPGSGKTTLCKHFGGIDSDDMITVEHGPVNDYLMSCDSIDDFVLGEGVIMRKLIDSINSGAKSGVFATGGSVVHDPATVRALKDIDDSVIVIWLHTNDATRGKDEERGVAWPEGVDSWEDLGRLRSPLYEDVAHIKMCTDGSIQDCANALSSVLCRAPNKIVKCDYSTFAPFRLSVSSRGCTDSLLKFLLAALIELKYDAKITMNTTINDGVVEPGFDILFTALAHSATAELRSLTTREHAMIIWPRVSGLLGLRCAYFEMFGRFSGCIHSFLMTKCPGAYPIR